MRTSFQELGRITDEETGFEYVISIGTDRPTGGGTKVKIENISITTPLKSNLFPVCVILYAAELIAEHQLKKGGP